MFRLDSVTPGEEAQIAEGERLWRLEQTEPVEEMQRGKKRRKPVGGGSVIPSPYAGKDSVATAERRRKAGVLGKESGALGKESGVLGKESGGLGKELGVLGKKSGVLGKESGALGSAFGSAFGTYGHLGGRPQG